MSYSANVFQFIIGRWRDTGPPILPGGLTWGREGIKVLGVFLGKESFKKKNWEGVLEKVVARLSKWKWLLPQLSYRGRVLVANNLAASTLWHKVTVLEPPSELICNIQRMIVDFFWSGEHWTRAAVLYLPVHEGGQGLVDVKSRIVSFRLQTVQKLLYQEGLSWIQTACAFLQKVERFGLDKHLFLMEMDGLKLDNLTFFYKSMIQAWSKVLKVERNLNESGDWINEEPLFNNPLIRTRFLSSVSIRRTLLKNGVTKLGHLLDNGGWSSVETFRELSGLCSTRIASKLRDDIFAVLPSSYRNLVAGGKVQQLKGDFPRFKISPAVSREQEELDGSILFFKTPQLEEFDIASKKALYYVTVKITHMNSLSMHSFSKWMETIEPDFLERDRWRALYKPPIEKRTADLQWRIIHRAIATNRHVAHLNPAVGGECRFCMVEETVEHLFLRCSRLGSLFRLLNAWFRGFGEEFSNEVLLGDSNTKW